MARKPFPRQVTLLFSVLAILSLVAATAVAAAPNSTSKAEDEDVAGVNRQDPQSAFAADVALLASESGLSTSDIESALAARDAFDAYALQLFARHPGEIAAAYVDPVPSTVGHIRFVNAIPAGVTAEVRELGLDVELSGFHEIALDENHLRSRFAFDALVAAGYQNFSTHYDVFDDKIHVNVTASSEDIEPDVVDIASIVRSSTDGSAELTGRALEVRESDVRITVYEGEGPLIELLHSRGGNHLLDDGSFECTSGWSVSGPNGDGIVTAGHCSGLNQFLQPGLPQYSMQWRDQEFGTGGDVEYHTTSHIELAEFYASATSIRDTLSFEQTHTMVGDPVCVYGRETNNRTCNHTVLSTGNCVNILGTVVCELAEASYQTGQLDVRDSGGGWSFSTKAYGVTSGISSSPLRAWFTPIREMELALNVTLKLK